MKALKQKFFLAGVLTFGLYIASYSNSYAQQIKVMSFNIRLENKGDSVNNWEFRRDWVGQMLNFYLPDFVGAQEVTHNQLLDMLKRSPLYAYIGVGRDDGKEAGEYSSLFYRKDKFELLKSATFWLSQTPEKAGVKGWDAACNRVVTWGCFKEKQSGKIVYVFNTHFDHLGQIAREQSSRLLLNKVKEIAGTNNAIVTGDFNSSPQSNVYNWITKGVDNLKGLYDTYAIAKQNYGPGWTFHGFGQEPLDKRERIDYIFLNKRFDIPVYEQLAEQRGSLFLSDHLPIMAIIDLDKLQ
jgi:endonuclease/exonuclease/phosphatase family metal-dependent hydrolase